MKFNFFHILILFNIFSLNSIHSFYIFPFKYFNTNLDELYKIHSNISKEEIFLNYTNSISIYTLIQIENYNTFEMFFKTKGKCTFLSNDSCINNIKNNIPNQNHINQNISKILDKIKNNNSDKCLNGIIGMSLSGYTPNSKCLSMISEIKENDKTVKNEVWSIKYYSSSQNKDFDGEIVIGIEPHNYEPSIYNETDYFKVYNHINELEFIDDYSDRWSTGYVEFTLKFNKVYFFKDVKNHSIENEIIINSTDNKEAILEFDLGMIKCPSLYFTLIKEFFFQNYINLNICKEIYFSEKYLTFVCDKTNLNIEIEKFYNSFPSIYFNHFELNYTFVLSGKDLFKEYDNKIYFMIFSKNERINNWRLGEIFLKKYYFTFNHDSKQIGFYNKNIYKGTNDNSQNNINNEKEKFNYGTIFLVIGIILLILEIIFAIYCCGKKGCEKNRRKRANELTDDNYDYLSDNNEKNKIINDN